MITIEWQAMSLASAWRASSWGEAEDGAAATIDPDAAVVDTPGVAPDTGRAASLTDELDVAGVADGGNGSQPGDDDASAAGRLHTRITQNFRKLRRAPRASPPRKSGAFHRECLRP